MKKHLLLTLLLLSFWACENEIDPSRVADFTVSKIVIEQGDQRQVQDFNYNTNGKLVSVINDINANVGSNEYIEVTNFLYENNQLAFKTYSYQSTDTVHRQDSLTYYGNGKIHKVYSSYAYGGIMAPNWVSEYTYNDDGTLRSRTSYNPTSPDTEVSNRFYWENGNVVKTEHSYGDALMYEVFYQYDNYPNYKLGNPFFSDYEISLANRNNLAQARYKDYSGLLDLACNPCNYSYEYNDFNLPKKVTYDWGSSAYITYDVKDNITN
ncbi:hypothetical protein [Roseivirga sp. E12]|uniref:hypothetical protein n=1 Tax=Roseivirga sp. E12 TaxID=2819237 RepID=UPI001ABC7200|nr:hypothetical protein [Roseivirga sp. E12]MBO3698325.1 hypothetical protein [Roseivirga sp. E12]